MASDVLAAAVLTTAHQSYLLQARQLQALSFSAHIPLVCFAIALPPLVLFAEWRYLRTGDEVYRTLARRWTRVMAALFAVGVVTGTILSFEMGILWPGGNVRVDVLLRREGVSVSRRMIHGGRQSGERLEGL